MSKMGVKKEKIRFLMAKPGLDGHDRGAKILSLALRDSGVEVIYLGLHQTPEQIIKVAIQEDVDIIGLSILSGAHMTIVPEVVNLAKKYGFFDDPKKYIILGGTIVSSKQIKELKEMGISEVFGPGTPTYKITEYVHSLFEDND